MDTENKSNLIAAINEVNDKTSISDWIGNGAGIFSNVNNTLIKALGITSYDRGIITDLETI